MTLHIHTQYRLNDRTAHSLHSILVMATSVMGMMKMGNTVPRVGLEPTTLTSHTSVIPLHHIGSLMSPLYPHPPVSVALCLRGQCRVLTTHMDIYIYMHRQDIFNNHSAHSLYIILVTEPVWGGWGNRETSDLKQESNPDVLHNRRVCWSLHHLGSLVSSSRPHSHLHMNSRLWTCTSFS